MRRLKHTDVEMLWTLKQSITVILHLLEYDSGSTVTVRMPTCSSFLMVLVGGHYNS